MSSNFEVFAGRSNPKLAKRIASVMGKPLGKILTKNFEDGEIFVKYEDNIRGKDVFLIQSICSPVNDSLMELCLMIDAAKRASAKSIIPVIPYFGYARQDRKDSSRVPISSKLVVNMLQMAGATRIISIDLHSPQIQGFFDIPMDHLYCTKVICKYLHNKFDPKETTFVAPDSGSMKMVQRYAEIMGVRFAMVYKNRIDDITTEAMFVIGEEEVVGKHCILIDDLTATCGTLNAASDILKEKGALSVRAVVSHCCLNPKGHANLTKGSLDELITTDTIPVRKNAKIKVLTVAELLVAAITRTEDGRSIADLFKYKPNEFEDYDYDDDNE
jgi:ribose-phosphate pyrophosphokinase